LLDACLDMETRPDLVQAARAFVRARLAEWELHDLSDDAALAASELVANAVIHARTSIRLRLWSDGLSEVTIEVYDENTRMPIMADTPPDATSGRGLHLIAALGTAWGTEYHADGKIVWVRLGHRAPESAESNAEECVDLRSAAGVQDALDAVDAANGGDGVNRGRRSDSARS